MADSPLGKPALPRSRNVRLQQFSSVPARLALPVVVACLAFGAQAQRSCEAWSAKLTAVEGVVEVLVYDRGPDWLPAATGHRVCTGDSIRVDAASRATLTLPDESALRLAEHTTIVLAEPPSRDGSLIELVRGLIHVISRDPRRLSFNTPYANAGLEGTEFDIRVDEARQQTEVTVLEGEVSLTTQTTELKVGSGFVAIARSGAQPTATPLATPIDVMRWASYYPPIIAGELPPADQAPQPNVDLADFFTRRAAARLGTARLDAAEEDLAAALLVRPDLAAARALKAMIALARFDIATARQEAAGALTADANSVPALIAKSHVEQAANELRDATRTAERAIALEPNNSIALVRMAELALARGDARASIAYATRAATLAPTAAMPLVVLGFAEMRGRNADAAHTAFERAAQLEPEAPLPRLGLASIATLRGDGLEARRQLELAVVSDPANALSRSYMAKQYETEHRDELTTSQLDLAKAFDPSDPTPWLYAAMQELRANRAVDALRNLRAANDRNGGRAVFRSRLLLDEDLATRSAAVGRVHTELGFERLALVDAWQAVADSPDNYAGHRLLADLYAYEPRHEVARTSSLLTAQLLQPLSVTPIKPQLAQPTSVLAQRAGPSEPSFDEFASPVAANGLKLLASSAVGNNGTHGSEVALAGLADRVAYGAGYYRFATDGFHANNDFEQELVNAFAQFQPTYDLSLQAELRSLRTESGDSTVYFDRAHRPLQRNKEKSDSLRLGAKHTLSDADTLLASVVYQEASGGYSDVVDFFGDVTVDFETQGYSIDVQHLRSTERVRLQNGAAYADQDEIWNNVFGPDAYAENAPQQQFSVYSYAHLSPRPDLVVTIGASLDRIENLLVDEEGFSPKLGVIWRVTPRTTIRAAALRALFSSITTSQQNPQPRLEPVQFAGFTQLVSVGTADRTAVRGLGIDHELTDRMFVGWEASIRDTDRPQDLGGVTQMVDMSERVQRGYFYWTPGDRVSASARFEKGRYTNEPSFFRISTMEVERLPLELRYFAPSGFTIGGRATAVHQAGWFSTPGPTIFDPWTRVPGAERFWTLDTFLSYRLPKRRGSLSLTADNLLDEQFNFQDIDPSNPSLFPERLVSLRFTLSFD